MLLGDGLGEFEEIIGGVVGVGEEIVRFGLGYLIDVNGFLFVNKSKVSLVYFSYWLKDLQWNKLRLSLLLIRWTRLWLCGINFIISSPILTGVHFFTLSLISSGISLVVSFPTYILRHIFRVKKVVVLGLFRKEESPIFIYIVANQVLIIGKYQQFIVVHKSKISLVQILFGWWRWSTCVIYLRLICGVAL